MSDTPKDESAPAKKLSPLEAVKKRQAEMRQGLQKKTQGIGAVRDDNGTGAGSTDAPLPRTNTPRRAGGS